MARDERGFTLIELMIVVVVIGILAAISLANYLSMQNRAKVSQVLETMHIVQLATEDFAVRNNAVYPQNGASVTAEGGFTLANLLPGGALPPNPFTNVPTNLDWSNVLLTPPVTDVSGGVSLNTVQSMVGGAFDQYDIVGTGETGAALATVYKNY